jgi:hypothetical protein
MLLKYLLFFFLLVLAAAFLISQYGPSLMNYLAPSTPLP